MAMLSQFQYESSEHGSEHHPLRPKNAEVLAFNRERRLAEGAFWSSWQRLLLPQHAIVEEERLEWMMRFRQCMEALNVAQASAKEACQQTITMTKKQRDDLLHQARYLCDWYGVITLLEWWQQHDDWECRDYCYYIHACLLTGELVKGQLALDKGMMRFSGDASLLKLSQQLLQFYQQLPFPLSACEQDSFRIIPMMSEHRSDFCWQYADPEIARRCNLPSFVNDDDWLNWYWQSVSDPDRRLFAVIDKQYGFVGSLSLEIYRGVGYFYYWFGSDFQGQGLGPKTVVFLLNLAQEYLGMHCCYAKVFDYNVPSQKALSKMGFETLPFNVQPPFENEWFYHLGPEKSEQRLYEELAQLLEDMNSVVELEKKIML